MAESERNNLEAHVDLCAERYRTLEKKLDSLEERMDKLEEHIIVIRTKLSESSAGNENASNKTIITIGTAFGVALLTGLITMTVNFVMK
jgi:predicted nuclease with TOPRIM domain